MREIRVTGDLAALSDRLLDGFGASDLYLGYGSLISVYVGDLSYAGLAGGSVAILQDGPDALSGSFSYASLLQMVGSFQVTLAIEGFSIAAADVFALGYRDDGGVFVRYDRAALVAAVDAGDYQVTGSGDADRLVPGQWLKLAGRDQLSGLGGDDLLNGGNGADRLFGGAGRDRLLGGAGEDRLDGGRGADVLLGGGGADLFVFGRGSGTDRIVGFEDGIDRLDLRSPDFELRQVKAGVWVDHADGRVLLEGMTMAEITAADFL